MLERDECLNCTVPPRPGFRLLIVITNAISL
jgi:hypothetical protein